MILQLISSPSHSPHIRYRSGRKSNRRLTECSMLESLGFMVTDATCANVTSPPMAEFFLLQSESGIRFPILGTQGN